MSRKTDKARQQRWRDKKTSVNKQINTKYLEFIMEMNQIVKSDRTLAVRVVPETG
jgi:hypothetical protein